jgi:hypothetical protein
VVIAVDFSKSFAPLDSPKTAALQTLANALQTAMTKRWPSASLYVTPIGNASLLASPPCGPAILYQGLLIAPRETNPTNRTISQPSVLSKWWTECIQQLTAKSQHVEAFTDISGAVALAAQSMRLSSGPKLLGIVSDFVEDLPKGNLAADFQLSGERVLLMYGPETSDGRNPSVLTKRLSDWEQRLQSAGASRVVRVPIAGLTAESLQTWIP